MRVTLDGARDIFQQELQRLMGLLPGAQRWCLPRPVQTGRDPRQQTPPRTNWTQPPSAEPPKSRDEDPRTQGRARHASHVGGARGAAAQAAARGREGGRAASERRATGRRRGVPPPPPSRTKWTRLVHPSILIGHVSSRMQPYTTGRRRGAPARARRHAGARRGKHRARGVARVRGAGAGADAGVGGGGGGGAGSARGHCHKMFAAHCAPPPAGARQPPGRAQLGML